MVTWENVQRQELVYKSSTCAVYQGVYENVPIFIKEVTLNSPEQAKMIKTEVSFQHPRMCKIYDFRYEAENKIVIVRERMDRTLDKEIQTRKQTETRWTDEELLHHFGSLINVFAAAQRAGICHRDIMPQSLWMKENELYIADFTYGKKMDGDETKTITGTPYYLSPELKDRMRGDFGSESGAYNPYKSDVYSLGLTFLFMCNLGPYDELTDLKYLESATAGAFGKLGTCDEIKQLLTLMLKVQADERPDFVVLESYFSTIHLVNKSDSSYQTSSFDIGNGEFQQAEQMLYVLNNSSLDDIHQTLAYCFASSTCLSVNCMIAVQCRVCSNMYQIDLSTAYATEYLYFCSQDCYCSSYQESDSQTSTVSVCMQCQKQFVPNTDWHISVQRSSPKFQLDLNTLCSIQCYHNLIQGLEEGTNAPPFSKKARPQYANMPRLPTATLRNQSRAQHSRFQGNGGLKKAKQKPENFEEAKKSANPAKFNIVPQIKTKGYIEEACAQCNKPKKPFLRCPGTRRTSDGKLLTHSFCENCSSVDGFGTKKCPMCLQLSINMKS